MVLTQPQLLPQLGLWLSPASLAINSGFATTVSTTTISVSKPESLLQHPLSTSAFDSALISSYRSVVRPVVAFSDLPLLEINEKSTTIIVQTLSTTAWPQPSLVAPLSAFVITFVSLCS